MEAIDNLICIAKLYLLFAPNEAHVWLHVASNASQTAKIDLCFIVQSWLLTMLP